MKRIREMENEMAVKSA